jgi:hypothetical protein
MTHCYGNICTHLRESNAKCQYQNTESKFLHARTSWRTVPSSVGANLNAQLTQTMQYSIAVQTTKCHVPSLESCYSGKVNGKHFPGDSKTSNEVPKLTQLTFHLKCTINTETAYAETSQTALMFPELRLLIVVLHVPSRLQNANKYKEVFYPLGYVTFCLLPASRSFLAWLILPPWTWRRRVPAKRQLTFNGLHGVTTQKTYYLLNHRCENTCSLVEGETTVVSIFSLHFLEDGDIISLRNTGTYLLNYSISEYSKPLDNPDQWGEVIRIKR